MLRFILAVAVAALAAASPLAAGLESDDVVRMAKANVGDEVIIAQLQAAKARFSLTAEDLIRLKKEGVSDAVLRVMIEARPPAAGPEGASAPQSGDRGPAKPGPEAGSLVLENLDSRAYSLQVDPEHRNVFYYWASSAEGREPLPARSSQVYRLAPGTYRLTWVAGQDSHAIKVLGGKESRVTLTRTAADGVEAVYLSLFEDGERRGGGRLMVLADNSAAPAPGPAQASAAAVVEKHYYVAPAQQTCYRPVPAYRDCCAARPAWFFPAFSYNWSRGRDGYAVGWGPRGDLGFSWHHWSGGRNGFSLGLGW
jgi:hypothetical protein